MKTVTGKQLGIVAAIAFPVVALVILGVKKFLVKKTTVTPIKAAHETQIA